MLTESVTVYVPGTVQVDRKLPRKAQDAIARRVMDRMAKWFGGATVSPATGGYVANDGRLVTERVLRVTSYGTPEGMADRTRDVYRLASALARRMGQESVAVERPGVGLDFVGPGRVPA